MQIQNRNQDLQKVFDSRWKINNNYQEKKEFLDSRNNHFNKLYNIKSKDDKRKEILEANSVNGRVERLKQNMNASSSNELLRNRNNFR